MTRRCRHHRQHGQVMVITALLATLLIGAAALAVDLSVQTGNRRNLQNVGDMAAIAGARDLYSDGTSLGGSDQANAVYDAFLTVDRQMGWLDGTLYANHGACSNFPPAVFTQYGIHGDCLQASYGGYTVTASTPPVSPRSLNDMDYHNVQVEITQGSSNGLAGVIGFSRSQERGHAVARHMTGGVSLDFALFSNTFVQAGNGSETVNGNVYANRYVQLQANGQSAFCAGVSSQRNDGYIILSAPQTSGNGQEAITPRTTPFLAPPGGLCANVTSSGVYQAGAGLPTCPTIPGVPDTLSYDPTIQACVSLPLTPPVAAPPPQSGNVVSIHSPCNGSGGGGGHALSSCWSSSTSVSPGLYQIYHNAGCDPPSCADLLVKGPMCLSNVSFWLEPGARMSINFTSSSSAGNCSWMPSGQPPTFYDSGPYNAGTGQPDDGTFVVYGGGGSEFDVMGSNTVAQFATGSIYMPGGSVIGGASSAGALLLQNGQAVVDTWQVSTGNQPNPEINYTGAFTPVSTETFRLVE